MHNGFHVHRMPEDTVHGLNELKEHIQLEEAIVQLETDVHGIEKNLFHPLNHVHNNDVQILDDDGVHNYTMNESDPSSNSTDLLNEHPRKLMKMHGNQVRKVMTFTGIRNLFCSKC